MNTSSGAALQALQRATLQRQAYREALLDDAQKLNMTLSIFMNNLYQEQGTLTELPQLLGQIGYLKWEERRDPADGQNG